MRPTAFYAWQSDAPNTTNRGFIRHAAEQALRAVEGALEDAPRIDAGVEDVGGTPELAGMIFTKIQQAALFIGDVSLVGVVGSKRTPNPNVLVALGSAAGMLGWQRILLVMNTHFGQPEELPSDLKNRWFPITYNLDGVGEKPEVRKQLARDLQRQS